MYDLLIKGGQVVLPETTIEADLGLAGQVISALGIPGSLGPARRQIDARGLFVLPGGIDPHVHLRWTPVPPGSDGLHPSTVAAACGGTTTLIDFVIQGADPIRASIQKRLAQAEGLMAIDYGLHVTITNATPEALAEIGEVVKAGIPSFKLMTAYRKLKWMLEDGGLYAAMVEAARWGALVAVHAENEDLLLSITRDLLAQGKTGVEYYEAGRPAVVEGEATRRAIYLAHQTGAALYLVHMTSEDALSAARAAQRSGQRVFAETCPHYLTFTDEVYRRPDARLFTVIPPLRSGTDRQALWEGVQDGAISCIGSDDALRTTAEKQQGETFDQIPMGLPGLETRVPVLYSEGVAKGRISINRLAEIVATGPARLFGLYPRKGVIAPGSDADLVLLDPSARRTIRCDGLHMPTDFTPFEGLDVQGYPVMTILRGQVIVENCELVDRKPNGRFVARDPVGRGC